MRRCFFGAVALSVAACLAAAACGRAGDRADGTHPDSEAGAPGADSAAHGAGPVDSMAPEAAAPGGAADPFAGFELDAGPGADAADRRIALLLRNHNAGMAIVYADGGAGEVLLDSVAAGSAVRIDILSRASMIALRSVTEDGALLRATEVSPGLDTIIEVVVGSAADSP